MFQPYIAFLAALLALALFALARPLVRSVWAACFVAFVAAQPALLYAYSQWSGVKEIAAACLIAGACALATGKGATKGLRSGLPAATAAAALAGVLSVGRPRVARRRGRDRRRSRVAREKHLRAGSASPC